MRPEKGSVLTIYTTTSKGHRQKRQRAGALQDAIARSGASGNRGSVLECGGPPPLFPERKGVKKVSVLSIVKGSVPSFEHATAGTLHAKS